MYLAFSCMHHTKKKSKLTFISRGQEQYFLFLQKQVTASIAHQNVMLRTCITSFLTRLCNLIGSAEKKLSRNSCEILNTIMLNANAALLKANAALQLWYVVQNSPPNSSFWGIILQNFKWAILGFHFVHLCHLPQWHTKQHRIIRYYVKPNPQTVAIVFHVVN